MLPTPAITIRTAVVEPGNEMEAVVKENSLNTWEIEIDDVTEDWYYEHAFAYDTTAKSAEWIEEAPTVNTRVSTLADFGSVRFTTAKFTSVDPTKTSLSSFYMINSTAQIISYPGAVSTYPFRPPCDLGVLPGIVA